MNINVKKLFGFGLALTATFLWAAAIVLSKAALDDINSNQLFFIQVIAAAVAAWLVVLSRGEIIKINKKTLIAYATGLFEPFLAYLLSLYGLMFVSAGVASVIYSTETVMIILLSCLLLKSKIESPLTFSTLIAIAGVGSYFAIYSGAQPPAAANNIGYALILLGVFFAALYVVISAKLVEAYSPTVLLAGQLSFCVLLFIVLILPFALNSFYKINGVTFFIAIVSGVLQYYLAFCCYLFSLKWIKVHVAGAVLYLIPVFTIALAAVLLGETVTVKQLLGILMIIVCLSFLHM